MIENRHCLCAGFDFICIIISIILIFFWIFRLTLKGQPIYAVNRRQRKNQTGGQYKWSIPPMKTGGETKKEILRLYFVYIQAV